MHPLIAYSIKREIGHLCHDERRPKPNEKQPVLSPADMSRSFAPVTVYQSPPQTSAWPIGVPQGQFLYQSETLGNEFSVLSDFLETLDEGSFFTSPPPTTTTLSPPLLSTGTTYTTTSTLGQQHQGQLQQQQPAFPRPHPPSCIPAAPADVVLPSATMQERFLLTAADQESGSRDERLNRVIRSKYEAGLLKPYNYVKGYARLSRWMDRNVSQESKQQILQPLSVLRPKFRAVAQSLRDLDLVFIEEAFERLLLDYDRVFSAMGVPACLWRRTGEIYKGNREFSELVGVDGYMLRDGRLCIYELMAEESAKYGHVAFDSSQKAVLTSCVLRYKPHVNTGGSVRDKDKIRARGAGADQGKATAGAGAGAEHDRDKDKDKDQDKERDKDRDKGREGEKGEGKGEGKEKGESPAKYKRKHKDDASGAGLEDGAPTDAGAGTPFGNGNGNGKGNKGGGGEGAGEEGGEGGAKEEEEEEEEGAEEGFINCCFSFTIRRDKWGIPTMIVGNFIKC
ncbi:hypothetical protein D9615_002158 [Tricholomella constricta]|uniref:ERT1/acuK family PAS domain-containing protein n=1 Tax=Tricholomella constricta TaxID=117010 RepID=A0A8H5HNU8_9AGAR|nr:hypothetical protein D9615_002158 [Tricholomella constricta]